MPTISPHLWFDKEAKEAAAFYVSTFGDSEIQSSSTLQNTPSGPVDIVAVKILGLGFKFLAAGPLFKLTPAVSFLVSCDSKAEVDRLWGELSKGGTPFLPLGAFPFSERYGWVQDKYGVSWQLMYANGREIQQRITPVLMFVGKQCGRAEEAINFYASVFGDSRVGDPRRYGKGEEPEKEGTIRFSTFRLEGKEFAAMDSARAQNIGFNEAISFMVNCDTQQEIDHYWGKLSADPKAEQCGWLKDKFGLSWQIIPKVLGEMLTDKDSKSVARVTEAFLKMKKFDIVKLKEAREGKRSVA